MRKSTALFVFVLLCLSTLSFAQAKINLATAFQEQQIKAVNRTLSLYDKSPGAVEMDAGQGDGLGILTDLVFDGGTIEVELLGENNPGRSFIGIAFNIQDEETFEAIYFRPFNFVAAEQSRKDHMVQYINHPEYTWSKLREERTMEFESELPLPPDPDDWFKATIKVTETQVEVYLDKAAGPVLKVERLSDFKSGTIGLWVGNGSSGRFRNLVLL